MENGKNENYEVFNMFKDRWALVAAGDMENHNACTVGWGSMGTLWSRPGHDGKSVIVYLHPSRYTRQLVQNSDYFTVSFFPDEYKKTGIHGISFRPERRQSSRCRPYAC